MASPGMQHFNEAYIKVSWVWLTLPAFLLGATIIFIFFNLIHAAHPDRNGAAAVNGSWLNGQLLPLFLTADGGRRKAARGAYYGSAEELLAAADDRKVCMVRDRDGEGDEPMFVTQYEAKC